MRFHFSFHKNLTKYTNLTLDGVFNTLPLGRPRFRHFNSRKAEFLSEARNLSMASLNNHYLAPAELAAISGEENTCSVFLRDPRDLLVSGYFYHRKGTERWTQVTDPTEEDYRIVNGAIPAGVQASRLSFCEYLNRCDRTEGLLAELEFRRSHFETMARWLDRATPEILFIDYSEIMQNEARAFARLGRHHRFNFIQMTALAHFAKKHRASNSSGNAHIRNPAPGQWKKTLTPDILEALNAQTPGLIARYEAHSCTTGVAPSGNHAGRPGAGAQRRSHGSQRGSGG